MLGTRSGAPHELPLRPDGVGYSVGISFRSFPEKAVVALGRKSDAVLQAGMCLFVNVNLRLPGVGLATGSDVFIVTDTGADALSTLPRLPFRC